VDDEQRCVHPLGDGRRSDDRLALGGGRMAVHVVVLLGQALFDERLDRSIDHVTVLGVHHGQDAECSGLGEPADEHIVGHHQSGVGHEELPAGGTELLGQVPQLIERVVRVRCRRHHQVETEIDHRTLFRGLPATVEGVDQALAGEAADEVHERRGSAGRRRGAAGLEVVRGSGGALEVVVLEMCVCVSMPPGRM
jgi:hypothetical protein